MKGRFSHLIFSNYDKRNKLKYPFILVFVLSDGSYAYLIGCIGGELKQISVNQCESVVKLFLNK